jgi:hypothetical protein
MYRGGVSPGTGWHPLRLKQPSPAMKQSAWRKDDGFRFPLNPSYARYFCPALTAGDRRGSGRKHQLRCQVTGIIRRSGSRPSVLDVARATSLPPSTLEAASWRCTPAAPEPGQAQSLKEGCRTPLPSFSPTSGLSVGLNLLGERLGEAAGATPLRHMIVFGGRLRRACLVVAVPTCLIGWQDLAVTTGSDSALSCGGNAGMERSAG